MAIAAKLDPTAVSLSELVTRYKKGGEERVKVLKLVELVYTQHFKNMDQSVASCRTLRTAFNHAFTRGGECELLGGADNNPFNDDVVKQIFGELQKSVDAQDTAVPLKLVIEPDQMDKMFEDSLAYARQLMIERQWAAAEWAVYGWVDAVFQRYFGSRGATVKGIMIPDIRIQSCKALDLHQMDMMFTARRLKIDMKQRGMNKNVEEKQWPLLPNPCDIFRCVRTAWAVATYLSGSDGEDAVRKCMTAGGFFIDGEEEDCEEGGEDLDEALLSRFKGTVFCPLIPHADNAYKLDHCKVRTRPYTQLWHIVQVRVFGKEWRTVAIGERYFRKFFASDAQMKRLDMYCGAAWCVWGGDLSVQLRYNPSEGDWKRVLAGRRMMGLPDKPDAEGVLPGCTPWAMPSGFSAQLPTDTVARRRYAAETILTLALGVPPPPSTSSKNARIKYVLEAFSRRKTIYENRPAAGLPQALLASGTLAAAASAMPLGLGLGLGARMAAAAVGGGVALGAADYFGASIGLPRPASAAALIAGVGAGATISAGAALFGVAVPSVVSFAVGRCVTAGLQYLMARRREFTPPPLFLRRERAEERACSTESAHGNYKSGACAIPRCTHAGASRGGGGR